MKRDGFYTSGQFAKMANVTTRTIRFYDKQNILKPSFTDESGRRFYSDSDFARLQQILLLKYLGFSLEEIRELTIDDIDRRFMLNSLQMQKKLVEDRIEQMQQVLSALNETTDLLKKEDTVRWDRMLTLIHLTGMENSLSAQYKSAVNLAARIRLHTLYTENRQGWFPWIFEQCHIRSGMRILELGCGDGSLWTLNRSRIPRDVSIILSDISDGMIRDARRNIGPGDLRFSFRCFDAQQIPSESSVTDDHSFDLIIGNHLLFYCRDIQKVCSEVTRLLKPDGTFLCSTYSARHMAEITQLVQDFDPRIVLSGEKLYENFGLENGAGILSEAFRGVQLLRYPDSLLVTDAQPLIEYILSCHGNQNRLLSERYDEFRDYVSEKTAGGFRITKDAGIFICRI